MRKYDFRMKERARRMRKEMTEAEKLLWNGLRKNQIGVPVYRQKPIGVYIVDFFIPKAGLVIEVDGVQHSTKAGTEYDVRRDLFLKEQGIHVIRIKNQEIMDDWERVFSSIKEAVDAGISIKILPPEENPLRPREENPPQPPFHKGGHMKVINYHPPEENPPQPPFHKGGHMRVINYHPPLAKGGQEGDFKPNYPDQTSIEIEGQKGDLHT